jgi:hypothetical protein
MSGIFDQDGNSVYSVGADVKKGEPANEKNQSSDTEFKQGQNFFALKPADKASGSSRQSKPSKPSGPARLSGAEPTPVRTNKETEKQDSGFKLEFTTESMVNGIILSELLGKPKILQKRRW